MLRIPGVAALLKQYYLRTMADKSDVFYLLTPLTTPEQAFKLGVTVMRIWQALSAREYYLIDLPQRPFPESGLAFVFRGGESPEPVRSLRLPYARHLLLDS
jgi:hypothetical protein